MKTGTNAECCDVHVLTGCCHVSFPCSVASPRQSVLVVMQKWRLGCVAAGGSLNLRGGRRCTTAVPAGGDSRRVLLQRARNAAREAFRVVARAAKGDAMIVEHNVKSYPPGCVEAVASLRVAPNVVLITARRTAADTIIAENDALVCSVAVLGNARGRLAAAVRAADATTARYENIADRPPSYDVLLPVEVPLSTPMAVNSADISLAREAFRDDYSALDWTDISDRCDELDIHIQVEIVSLIGDDVVSFDALCRVVDSWSAVPALEDLQCASRGPSPVAALQSTLSRLRLALDQRVRRLQDDRARDVTMQVAAACADDIQLVVSESTAARYHVVQMHQGAAAALIRSRTVRELQSQLLDNWRPTRETLVVWHADKLAAGTLTWRSARDQAVVATVSKPRYQRIAGNCLDVVLQQLFPSQLIAWRPVLPQLSWVADLSCDASRAPTASAVDDAALLLKMDDTFAGFGALRALRTVGALCGDNISVQRVGEMWKPCSAAVSVTMSDDVVVAHRRHTLAGLAPLSLKRVWRRECIRDAIREAAGSDEQACTLSKAESCVLLQLVFDDLAAQWAAWLAVVVYRVQLAARMVVRLEKASRRETALSSAAVQSICGLPKATQFFHDLRRLVQPCKFFVLPNAHDPKAVYDACAATGKRLQNAIVSHGVSTCIDLVWTDGSTTHGEGQTLCDAIRVALTFADGGDTQPTPGELQDFVRDGDFETPQAACIELFRRWLPLEDAMLVQGASTIALSLGGASTTIHESDADSDAWGALLRRQFGVVLADDAAAEVVSPTPRVARHVLLRAAVAAGCHHSGKCMVFVDTPTSTATVSFTLQEGTVRKTSERDDLSPYRAMVAALQAAVIEVYGADKGARVLFLVEQHLAFFEELTSGPFEPTAFTDRRVLERVTGGALSFDEAKRPGGYVVGVYATGKDGKRWVRLIEPELGPTLNEARAAACSVALYRCFPSENAAVRSLRQLSAVCRATKREVPRFALVTHEAKQAFQCESSANAAPADASGMSKCAALARAASAAVDASVDVDPRGEEATEFTLDTSLADGVGSDTVAVDLMLKCVETSLARPAKVVITQRRACVRAEVLAGDEPIAARTFAHDPAAATLSACARAVLLVASFAAQVDLCAALAAVGASVIKSANSDPQRKQRCDHVLATSTRCRLKDIALTHESDWIADAVTQDSQGATYRFVCARERSKRRATLVATRRLLKPHLLLLGTTLSDAWDLQRRTVELCDIQRVASMPSNSTTALLAADHDDLPSFGGCILETLLRAAVSRLDPTHTPDGVHLALYDDSVTVVSTDPTERANRSWRIASGVSVDAEGVVCGSTLWAALWRVLLPLVEDYGACVAALITSRGWPAAPGDLAAQTPEHLLHVLCLGHAAAAPEIDVEQDANGFVATVTMAPPATLLTSNGHEPLRVALATARGDTRSGAEVAAVAQALHGVWRYDTMASRLWDAPTTE